MVRGQIHSAVAFSNAEGGEFDLLRRGISVLQKRSTKVIKGRRCLALERPAITNVRDFHPDLSLHGSKVGKKNANKHGVESIKGTLKKGGFGKCMQHIPCWVLDCRARM